MAEPVSPPAAMPPLGILLLSGTHDRAHAAFLMAATAAALDRRTVLFATNGGCRALLADWSSLADAGEDAVWRGRGVAGLAELREHAMALGARCLACEAGLKAGAIDPAGLLPGVAVGGMAGFLAATEGGAVVSF